MWFTQSRMSVLFNFGDVVEALYEGSRFGRTFEGWPSNNRYCRFDAWFRNVLGLFFVRANVPGRKIPSDLANALLVSIRNC